MSIDANAINGYPRGIDLFELNVNFGVLIKNCCSSLVWMEEQWTFRDKWTLGSSKPDVRWSQYTCHVTMDRTLRKCLSVRLAFSGIRDRAPTLSNNCNYNY